MTKKNSVYSPLEIENSTYKYWRSEDLFSPIKKTKGSKNFSIILPPPNVTGHLHIGHAWDVALQDCLIRYKKLNGFRTIWIPGTDHAGIATQTKFENILKQQGVKRSNLSEKEFLSQMNTWALDQASYIRKQWAKLGLALSYDHETFTLDKNVNDLIYLEFEKLYKDKLIYRARKLVNWDVKQKSAISDIEVIHKETKSKMYYFKYFLEDSDKYIVVATTRPETMFVDRAIFVNPKDKRYAKLVGKRVINPINGQPLVIMTDSYIDVEFGTGAMKCTPAHDFNDYALAKKHGMKEFVSVIGEDGKLNKGANTKFGKYAGMDRIEAREKIVSEMASRNLVEKIEEHISNVGYSERTNEVVEPLLSLQWFVKMNTIVAHLKTIMKKQPVKVFPIRFEKVLNDWMNKTEDWCISRQLVWGHRIPAWYNKKDSTKIHVGVKPPKDIENWKQDVDVLDTWFSSGLWPLAQTKYSKNPKLLSEFYPISVLVTGWDIIFFWVARMLFQCSYIDNSVSLKNVLLHGLIRDEQNRKMSKTLGNVVDPNVVIDRYGADALRAFLLSATPNNGEDMCYSEQKVKYIWSFLNKLWNASNLTTANEFSSTFISKGNEVDKWIVERLAKTIKAVTKSLDAYNFNFASETLLNFAWEDFCNCYLEISRKTKSSVTQKTINYVFTQILIMLHPFSPFVTEKLFSKYSKTSIMLAKWPKASVMKAKSSSIIEYILPIYHFSRDLRIKHSIKASTLIELNLISKTKVDIELLNEYLNKLNINVSQKKNAVSTSSQIENFAKFSVQILNEFENKAKKLENLKMELTRLDSEIKRSEKILSNPNFLSKASKQKITDEQQKFNEYKKQYSDTSILIENIDK